VTILQRFDRHADEIAGLHFDFAAVVVELLDRDVALGLESCVDDHVVGVDTDHLGGDHLTLAHFLAQQAFFEQGGEALRRMLGDGVGDGGGSSRSGGG
jgi:hypothetical protein